MCNADPYTEIPTWNKGLRYCLLFDQPSDRQDMIYAG